MRAMAVKPEFVICEMPGGWEILVNRTLVTAVRQVDLSSAEGKHLVEGQELSGCGKALCYVYQYDGKGLYLEGLARTMARRLGVIVKSKPAKEGTPT